MKSTKAPALRTSFATRVRTEISTRLEILVEVFGLVFAASGATIAAVLGKFIVGLVLAGLALGFLLRLKSRKRRLGASPLQDATLSTIARILSGVVSTIEVAALVEATNLPIRFEQSGFHMGHWYLVLLAFLAAYFLQLPLIAKLLSKRSAGGTA